MSETAERIKAELFQLPVQERAELAQLLLWSLEAEEDPDAEAAWDAELAQRADDIKTGREKGEPAATVFRELREKYS